MERDTYMKKRKYVNTKSRIQQIFQKSIICEKNMHLQHFYQYKTYFNVKVWHRPTLYIIFTILYTRSDIFRYLKL